MGRKSDDRRQKTERIRKEHLFSMVTAMHSTNDSRSYKNTAVIIGLIVLVLGVRYRSLVAGN